MLRLGRGWGDGVQVEIHVRGVHVLMKALPQLGLNLDDAARSEAEYEAADRVGGCTRAGLPGEGTRG